MICPNCVKGSENGSFPCRKLFKTEGFEKPRIARRDCGAESEGEGKGSAFVVELEPLHVA